MKKLLILFTFGFIGFGISQSSVIKTGQTWIIPNVFFDIGKYDLLSESYPALDSIAEVLKAHPEFIKVEIGAHTDISCEKCSSHPTGQRAKAIADYLIETGIDVNRILARGYGESRPLDTNDTPEGRQNNRRVEITVLAIK